MKNLNSSPLFGEGDSDDSDEAPSTPKAKPLPKPAVSFVLNAAPRPAPQAPQTAAEQAKPLTPYEADKAGEDTEEDDDDSDEAPSVTSRQSQASQTLRALFRRRRFTSRSLETANKTAEPAPDTSEVQQIDKKAEMASDEKPSESTFESGEPDEEDQPPVVVLPRRPPPSTSSRPTASSAGGGGSSNGPRPPRPPQSPRSPQPPRPPQPPVGGNAAPPPPPFNAANYVPQPPQPNVTPQTAAANKAPSTVIERDNAAGAAVLAFLGALYLNRRRKRDIRGLRKDDKRNQQRTQAEQARASAAEAAIRTKNSEQEQRLASLEQSRADQRRAAAQAMSAEQAAAAQAPESILQASNETNIKQAAETMVVPGAAAATEKIQTPNTSPSTVAEVIRQSSESRIIPPKPERPLKQPDNVVEQVSQALKKEGQKEPAKQFEQPPQPAKAQAEANIRSTREKVFDRRHEVKDPVLPNGVPGASAASRAAQSQPAGWAAGAAPAVSSTSTPTGGPAASAPTQTDKSVYQQSMQVGFMVGLAVVVLGAIAYLLLA